MTSRLGLAASLIAAMSCSGTPEGTVSIVTGDETEVFSRAPQAVLLVAERVALDGKRTEIVRANLPLDAIDLGEVPRTDVGAIAIAGLDAAAATVVRGATLFVQWGALETSTLEVFAQRTGELARMPRGPAQLDPTAAAVLSGRYLLEASGTATAIYDLLTLKTFERAPTLPRPARSLAVVANTIVAIDEAGASTFDLGVGTTSTLEPPPGGTFGEVAGGARVTAPDGTQLIVGATRLSGGPTARVLLIDPEGIATFASLAAPREGACATWVEGRGLVVYGGGDAGAPGAELLATGTSLGTPLPFPPDPAKGCAAATLDNGHVAIAGGPEPAGPARVLDLACAKDCALATWPDTVPLVRAQAYALGADAMLVAGDDASGATHVYRASASGTKEIPLKIPRRGARLVVTPLALAIVGGGAGIEQYLE